jgi:hypothetical protein
MRNITDRMRCLLAVGTQQSVNKMRIPRLVIHVIILSFNVRLDRIMR